MTNFFYQINKKITFFDDRVIFTYKKPRTFLHEAFSFFKAFYPRLPIILLVGSLSFYFLRLLVLHLSRLYKPPREQGLSDKLAAAALLAAEGHFINKLKLLSYSVGRFFRFLLFVIACPSPTCCSIIARTFSGRPNNVMKPSASLWL